MIDLNSHFPLMVSAVHIAIYDIIKASRLIDPDNFDIMFPVIFTVVNSFISTETEHFCECILRLIVTPEFALLYKSDRGSGLIRLILHISGAYPKLNIIVKKACIFPAENLIHPAFKIEQIHPAACIAHSVIFFYIIIFTLATLTDTRHNIIQHDHIIGIRNFFYGWHRRR